MNPHRSDLSEVEQIELARSRRGLEGCLCTWRYEHLGTLYGVSFGHAWLPLQDNPDCPVHP